MKSSTADPAHPLDGGIPLPLHVQDHWPAASDAFTRAALSTSGRAKNQFQLGAYVAQRIAA
jgi:hypothetical protein